MSEFRNRVRNFEMTAEDWQLYTVTMDCEPAAKALNDALFKTLEKYPSDWRKVRDEMFEIMDGYSQYGARDTEPEVSLCCALEVFFPEHEHEIGRWT